MQHWRHIISGPGKDGFARPTSCRPAGEVCHRPIRRPGACSCWCHPLLQYPSVRLLSLDVHLSSLSWLACWQENSPAHAWTITGPFWHRHPSRLLQPQLSRKHWVFLFRHCFLWLVLEYVPSPMHTVNGCFKADIVAPKMNCLEAASIHCTR